MKTTTTINLEIQTLEQLNAFLIDKQINNRSAFIEKIILKEMDKPGILTSEKTQWSEKEKDNIKHEFFKVLRGIGRKYPLLTEKPDSGKSKKP